MMLKNYLLIVAFFVTTFAAMGGTIKGTVQDAETKLPIEGVFVGLEGTGIIATTDAQGNFILYEVPASNYVIEFATANYIPVSLNVKVEGSEIDLGIVQLLAQPENASVVKEDFIPTISLSDDDLDQLSTNQNISGVLTASRDVFVSAAAFTFGPARFRIRGFDSENTLTYLNGVPMNKLENGRVFWNAWGGLNEVTRLRDADIGLGVLPYAFGGVGGATTIDTRASSFRKQSSISYANSNRAFRHRVMGTYSSGLLNNGWAFVASGSRRWAEEGYIDGTFYDAWAYFLSVDKRLNKNHTLNLTAFDAPIRRGRSTSSVQEMYDLAGTNFYNPLWGYQNGEKRNSSVAYTNQPMVILRHDFKIKDNASLTTALSYQFGTDGTTGLDWFDAADPRPDYYRNLPSYIRSIGDAPTDEVSELAEQRAAELRSDESKRQINWGQLYDANRNSQLNQKYAYLLGANPPEGKWSQYILEDRRSDTRDVNLNVNYQNVVSDRFSFYAGGSYQVQSVHNFKVIDDLLGGDYYVNVDRFAVRDSVANYNAQQNDLNNPSQVLREGDTWGYNYDINVHKWDVWAQGVLTLRKFDIHLAANASGTSFWRTGKYLNGRFPNNSFGDSEVQDFTNYGAKAGITYKLDGRNYFFANAAYLTRAPYVESAYVSPRSRDQIVPNLTDEKVTSAEVGYYLRSPNVKGRLTAYYAQFEDQLRIYRFFNDFERAFGNDVLSNLDTRHIGLEFALDVKLFAGLNLTTVAAIGDYRYTSRAIGNTYQDNATELASDEKGYLVYTKNFRVAGLPQQAYTIGLNYRSPKFWFLNVNFNYFDDIYIDFSPVRRTADAVFGLDENSEEFRNIIDQQKADAQFTVDVFGGKSFKFGKYFIFLNVGVSNVLNNQDFISGGFEQLRFDVRDRNLNQFPPRYFYNFGLNYFANVSFRF